MSILSGSSSTVESFDRRAAAADEEDDGSGSDPDDAPPPSIADLGFSVEEMQRALAVAERMCSDNLSRNRFKQQPPQPQLNRIGAGGPSFANKARSPSSPMFARKFAPWNSGGGRSSSPAGSAPGTPVLGSRAGSPAPDAVPGDFAADGGQVSLAGTVLKSGRYVPPKQLLLYVVRMGSFTSTKKIVNEDRQDDDVVAELHASGTEDGRGDDVAGPDSGRVLDVGRPSWPPPSLTVVAEWRRRFLDKCRSELSGWPALVRRRWTEVRAAGALTASPGNADELEIAGLRIEESVGSTERSPAALAAVNGLAECDDREDGRRGAFRLMQWNVLSQALGTARDSFALCPSEALEWKQRRYRMLEEILAHKADIVCLQEVDHYKFLAAHLAKLGYRGSFVAKPDSPCIYIPDNNGPDGCAIFFDEAKFELVEEFSRVIQVWKVQSNQVVVVQILRELATGRELCVAATHLKAKDGALLATIRHEEGLDLVAFVKSCSAGRPTVVCGDFNATPQEPVYAAMLRSGLKLASAYATANKDGGGGGGRRIENPSSKTPAPALVGDAEPEYTTWKVRATSSSSASSEAETKCTLDYVFYSKRRLDVKSVLGFPSGDDLGPERLPSFRYPSDHLSLVCDFAFLDDDDEDDGGVGRRRGGSCRRDSAAARDAPPADGRAAGGGSSTAKGPGSTLPGSAAAEPAARPARGVPPREARRLEDEAAGVWNDVDAAEDEDVASLVVRGRKHSRL